MALEMPRDYNLEYAWPPQWQWTIGTTIKEAFNGERPPTEWLKSLGYEDPDPACNRFVGSGRRKSETVSRLTVRYREEGLWLRQRETLVWHTQDWFKANTAMGEWVFPFHANDTMHFFQTQRDASRKKWTEAKEARFLGRFFPDIPEAERARLAEWQITHSTVGPFGNAELYPLHAATTPDEIAEAYYTGPKSCMGGQYFSIVDHPTRAYGAGDLAVFYMVARGDEGGRLKKGGIIGRSLCWPEKKVFNRVYPTSGANWSDGGFANQIQAINVERAMIDRFRQMGWQPLASSKTGFHGARLLAIAKQRGASLMPYGDGSLYAKPTPEGYVICSSADSRAFAMADASGYRRDQRVTWNARTVSPGPIPEPPMCGCCETRAAEYQATCEDGSTIPICSDCISCAYAISFRGTYYYNSNRLTEEVYSVDPRGYRDRHLMPRWWLERNAFICPYLNARVFNTSLHVVLHNGRKAATGMFTRSGGYTLGEVNYFSRGVANYVRAVPQVPLDFDQLEALDYELVDELAAADEGDAYESPNDDE